MPKTRRRSKKRKKKLARKTVGASSREGAKPSLEDWLDGEAALKALAEPSGRISYLFTRCRFV